MNSIFLLSKSRQELGSVEVPVCYSEVLFSVFGEMFFVSSKYQNYVHYSLTFIPVMKIQGKFVKNEM